MQYFLPAADFISKIDSNDAKTLYLVCHFEKHIIDNKSQFSFGINIFNIFIYLSFHFFNLGNLMCIHDQEKKSMLYESECIFWISII